MQTPHVFGEHQHLFGLHRSPMCSHESRQVEQSKIAVLMLTAGMLSNVGPSRLHVALADELSRDGIPSFRFDLSGIGDSLAVGSTGPSLKRASNEVKQAMDMLGSEYGYTHFMLFGLCSGADDAIPSAAEDERIIGASLVDACGYRTRGHFMPFLRRKYLPKVLSATKWMELIGKARRSNGENASTMPQGTDIREFPDREQSEAIILGLIDRGVQLQFIYTGGVIDYYSHAGQFNEMFPRLKDREEISVLYQPRWDHVAMLREDRTELMQAVVAWFRSTRSAFHSRPMPSLQTCQSVAQPHTLAHQ